MDDAKVETSLEKMKQAEKNYQKVHDATKDKKDKIAEEKRQQELEMKR